MTTPNDEQPGEKKPKVAKTMLYRKPQKPQDLPTEQQTSPPAPPENLKAKVAKTKLDHKLIMQVRAQFEDREKERLQQEITKRELEPVKIIEPLKAQKKVSSCPFSWTEDSVKLRFKHCSNCQKAIYQLDGLEMEEAEALILKRENRDKFVLFERPDGKFMTSDCPVAQKRRLQLAGLVAAVCVCIVVAVVAFIMMPPAPPPTAATSNDAAAPPAVSSEAESSQSANSSQIDSAASTSTKSDSSSTGTHHYEAGDPIPAVPSSGTSTKKPEKTFSEQEQSGEFWQFPNGQPADSPGASAPNQ